jgi:hypothetical protein
MSKERQSYHGLQSLKFEDMERSIPFSNDLEFSGR